MWSGATDTRCQDVSIKKILLARKKSFSIAHQSGICIVWLSSVYALKYHTRYTALHILYCLSVSYILLVLLGKS